MVNYAVLVNGIAVELVLDQASATTEHLEIVLSQPGFKPTTNDRQELVIGRSSLPTANCPAISQAMFDLATLLAERHPTYMERMIAEGGSVRLVIDNIHEIAAGEPADYFRWMTRWLELQLAQPKINKKDGDQD